MRVALFDPVGSYFSAPTLRCILEEFDRLQCEVHVFLRSGGEHLSTVSRAEANPFPVPFRVWAGNWENTLRQWKWYIRYGARRASRLLKSERYDFAIGVNPEGVVAAHRYWKATGTPFVYLSFEMIFKDELYQGSHLQLKREEVAASRAAALVISQDKWRARLLSHENGISIERIALLPVSPRGGPSTDPGFDLRRVLQIGGDQTLVLQAGAFKRFSCADQIMDSLDRWPKGFVLVVNTFYSPDTSDPFLERLRRIGSENVRVTPGNFSPSDLNTLVQQADIGLALYHAEQETGGRTFTPFSGKNIGTMGLSSGKLAVLARNGVPIVCGGNRQLRELLPKYRFGEYLETLDDLPACLLRVQAGRDAYAAGALRFFAEELDFDRFWPAIWERIRAAVGRTVPSEQSEH